MGDKHVDEYTGVETTGHEWDGIMELNNPMPRWWLWIFYATCIWALGYWVFYPAWPLVSDYTKGVLGFSQRANVAEDVIKARENQTEFLVQIEANTFAEIKANPDLLNFALAGGKAAFAVNCSQCHGRGAQGFVGYPNLNDDEWLWGGEIEQIHHTIAHGIRNQQSDEAHDSAMPAFLKDGILEREQIDQVAHYVLQLSGQEHDAEKATAGKEPYVENCAACHGEGGEGIVDLGAPALNNQVWLYGGDLDTLKHTISYSRAGVMPAWGLKLEPVTIKQLAVYVHSLGGGK